MILPSTILKTIQAVEDGRLPVSAISNWWRNYYSRHAARSTARPHVVDDESESTDSSASSASSASSDSTDVEAKKKRGGGALKTKPKEKRGGGEKKADKSRRKLGKFPGGHAAYASTNDLSARLDRLERREQRDDLRETARVEAAVLVGGALANQKIDPAFGVDPKDRERALEIAKRNAHARMAAGLEQHMSRERLAELGLAEPPRSTSAERRAIRRAAKGRAA
jgi:hypothetical protein